jgi:FdhD protein
MRTPGEDFELIAGFLLAEGIVSRASDISMIRYCSHRPEVRDLPEAAENIVDVDLAEGVEPPGREAERAFLTTSACGICGKTSLDAVRTSARWSLEDDKVEVPAALLATLPDRLRERQKVFARTGGLHGAGLFARTGEPLCVREDVGRHNAVDKVLGWALQSGRVPLRGCVLQVSGRASFELVQKAVMAGVPVLSAVSAPSSLAVDLAESAGLTLIGFARGTSMNVYAGAQRVV